MTILLYSTADGGKECVVFLDQDEKPTREQIAQNTPLTVSEAVYQFDGYDVVESQDSTANVPSETPFFKLGKI
jgi:hypothetical protein